MVSVEQIKKAGSTAVKLANNFDRLASKEGMPRGLVDVLRETTEKCASFAETAIQAVNRKQASNVVEKPNEDAVKSAMKSVYGDQSQAALTKKLSDKIPVHSTGGSKQSAIKLANEKLQAAEKLQKQAEVLLKRAAEVPGSKNHLNEAVKGVSGGDEDWKNPYAGGDAEDGGSMASFDSGGGDEALLKVKSKKMAAINAAYRAAFRNNK